MTKGNMKKKKRGNGLRAQRRRKRRRRRILFCAGLVCAAVAVALLAGMMLYSDGEDTQLAGDVSAVSADASAQTEAETESADAGEEEEDEPVTITLSFVGDCTLGTDETFGYAGLPGYYEQYGADYFFENVRSVFEADDLTVVNLEGVFTTLTTRKDKTYAFKADPEYVSIMTGSSIEAANVANNHSSDYGEQSAADTIETLESNGIAHFGNDDIALLEVQGITVGLIGIYELALGTGVSDQVTERIQEARAAGADIVVVSFHWGIEKDTCPDSAQVTLAHLAIDEGADLVIGHHPHVLQGIEYYNGKTIAYSLGNFCFGGNSNPTDKDTMILQMSFTVQKETQADDEQSGIISSELTIIPCRISSATAYNDYQPTILSGDEAQDVLEKLDERSQEILSSYSVQAVYSSTEESE